MSHTAFGFGDAIAEKSTAKYTCQLTDPGGVAIAGAAVSAIAATLKAVDAGTVINSRTNQNVLNTNGGTLGTGGDFALVLSALDTIAVGTADFQRRRLTLDVTYTNGRVTHEVEFYIRALADIS